MVETDKAAQMVEDHLALITSASGSLPEPTSPKRADNIPLSAPLSPDTLVFPPGREKNRVKSVTLPVTNDPQSHYNNSRVIGFYPGNNNETDGEKTEAETRLTGRSFSRRRTDAAYVPAASEIKLSAPESNCFPEAAENLECYDKEPNGPFLLFVQQHFEKIWDYTGVYPAFMTQIEYINDRNERISSALVIEPGLPICFRTIDKPLEFISALRDSNNKLHLVVNLAVEGFKFPSDKVFKPLPRETAEEKRITDDCKVISDLVNNLGNEPDRKWSSAIRIVPFTEVDWACTHDTIMQFGVEQHASAVARGRHSLHFFKRVRRYTSSKRPYGVCGPLSDVPGLNYINPTAPLLLQLDEMHAVDQACASAKVRTRGKTRNFKPNADNVLKEKRARSEPLTDFVDSDDDLPIGDLVSKVASRTEKVVAATKRREEKKAKKPRTSSEKAAPAIKGPAATFSGNETAILGAVDAISIAVRDMARSQQDLHLLLARQEQKIDAMTLSMDKLAEKTAKMVARQTTSDLSALLQEIKLTVEANKPVLPPFKGVKPEDLENCANFILHKIEELYKSTDQMSMAQLDRVTIVINRLMASMCKFLYFYPQHT